MYWLAPRIDTKTSTSCSSPVTRSVNRNLTGSERFQGFPSGLGWTFFTGTLSTLFCGLIWDYYPERVSSSIPKSPTLPLIHSLNDPLYSSITGLADQGFLFQLISLVTNQFKTEINCNCSFKTAKHCILRQKQCFYGKHSTPKQSFTHSSQQTEKLTAPDKSPHRQPKRAHQRP